MKRAWLILVCIAAFLPGISNAQDTLTKKEIRLEKANFLLQDRPWTIEIPLWIPGFAGDFAYGEIEIEGEDGVNPVNPVEPPPGGIIGEIFSRLFTDSWYLKFFFMNRIAYEKDQYLVQLDVLTGAVGESVQFNYGDFELVKASFRTTNFRMFGGYKIVNHISENHAFQYELFGYAGIRTYLQKVTSDLGGGTLKLDLHPTRYEPIFGIQNQFTLKRWFFILQADYGGFFAESNNSFQMSMNTYFRSGKATSLKLGWNHLYLDQSGDFLDETYTIHATLSGPSIGIAFQF